MESSILVFSDHVLVPVSAVMSAINDPLILTQASHLKKLPLESVSVDIIVCIMGTVELLDQFLEEISRVLKPGGTVLIQAPQPATASTDKAISTFERKLLLAGYLELQVLDLKTLVPEENVQSVTVSFSSVSLLSHSDIILLRPVSPRGRLGHLFPLRKQTPILPKVQHDYDLDLIDEDSLLTEEDLKKPELPSCAVGSSKKACKNCTCGWAEAEEKVVKLGLTEEQIENPQSACGSCGLGDAFCCASYPYKGLLAFKLGEKLSLSSNFLVSDF
ncbi:hypothetical protein MKX01_036081 [Papaver californicum]|nr:hypothetical protein MKX01_036081 [Papaver californicum]